MRVRSGSPVTPLWPARATGPRGLARALAPVVVGTVVLAGCSGGDDPQETSQPGPTVASPEPDDATQPEPTTADEPAPSSDDAPATDDASAPTPTDDATSEAGAPTTGAPGSAPIDLAAAALTEQDFPLAGYERDGGDADDVWGERDDDEATVFGNPVTDPSADCLAALELMDTLGASGQSAMAFGFERDDDDDASPEFDLVLSQDPEDAAAVLLTLPEVCGQVGFQDDDGERTDVTFTPFAGDADGVTVTETEDGRTEEYALVTELVGGVRVVVLAQDAAPDEAIQVLLAQAEKIRTVTAG